MDMSNYLSKHNLSMHKLKLNNKKVEKKTVGKGACLAIKIYFLQTINDKMLKNYKNAAT